MSVLRKIGAFSIDSQWFEKSGLKDWILHNEVWYIFIISVIFVMWNTIKIRTNCFFVVFL